MSTQAMELTYQETEKEVFKLAHAFQNKYGGEWDEICQEARLAFAKAYHSYQWKPEGKSNGAKFSTWLWHCVWGHLLTGLRPRIKDYKNTHHGEVDFGNFAAPSKFDGLAFAQDLSPDAQTVVQLTLDPPPVIKLDLNGKRGLNDPAKLSDAVVEYLKELGWAGKRILESFREIGDALMC